MLHKDWQLATEEQKARIASLKAKISDQEEIEDTSETDDMIYGT